MVRARDMVEVTGSEGVGFINIIIYMGRMQNEDSYPGKR